MEKQNEKVPSLEDRYSAIPMADRDKVYDYFLAKMKINDVFEVNKIAAANRKKFVVVAKYAEKWDDFKLHGFRIRINLAETIVKKEKR